MLRARGVATSSYFIVTAASKSRRLLWPSSSSSSSSLSRWTATTTVMRTSSQHTATSPPSYPVVAKHDFGPLKEYSVIHTDRSLNLMSTPFGTVMRDLNALLKHTYNAAQVAIIPGSGTFGMEAVARQFAEAVHVLILRNGWFSYRWTEILEVGRICRSSTVLKAEPVITTTNTADVDDSPRARQRRLPQYRPAAIERVVATIAEERPSVVFMPHVETSTGIILPDEYIRQVADAVHALDDTSLVVLDCIASGTIWVDMDRTGVDVLISAPQKGWTGPPCAALVMLSPRAVNRMQAAKTESSSFSLSLKRWCAIMEAYEKGGFAYHTTMPTDALRDFHEISVETLQIGLPVLKQAQWQLGERARRLLEDDVDIQLRSVAAPGYQAPGVLVYYSPTDDIPNPAMMAAFKQTTAPPNLQIAMGVPWKIDEPAGLKTFRIGLFGLDKLTNVDRTIDILDGAVRQVLQAVAPSPPPHPDPTRSRL